MTIQDREQDQLEFARETDGEHLKLGNPSSLMINGSSIEEVIEDPKYQELPVEQKHKVWDLLSGFDRDGNEIPEYVDGFDGTAIDALSKVLKKDAIFNDPNLEPIKKGDEVTLRGTVVHLDKNALYQPNACVRINSTLVVVPIDKVEKV